MNNYIILSNSYEIQLKIDAVAFFSCSMDLILRAAINKKTKNIL